MNNLHYVKSQVLFKTLIKYWRIQTTTARGHYLPYCIDGTSYSVFWFGMFGHIFFLEIWILSKLSGCFTGGLLWGGARTETGPSKSIVSELAISLPMCGFINQEIHLKSCGNSYPMGSNLTLKSTSFLREALIVFSLL